jgi:2-keto-4-pentenoate hydratase
MKAQELQAAVEALWECREQGIYYPPEWKGKLNTEAGYRIQLGILAKYLKAGERHKGWKVGLTAKAIQEQVKFHEPVFGFLLESGWLRSRAKIVFEDLVAPSFESELCVTLGQTLKGPDVTPRQARAAIIAVAPSIEVVEKRGDFAADPPLSMADNVQQKYFVTGAETRPLPAGLELGASRVEILINGELVDRAEGTEVLGDPAASVAWLANKLAEFGRRLEAGMMVMTGSFTKQYPLTQGDLIEARFHPFGPVILEVG